MVLLAGPTLTQRRVTVQALDEVHSQIQRYLLVQVVTRMSPFVVFVGVLFFGWLWGVAGLILAFPLMVAVKIVCDRVDDLKPVGQPLGA